MTFDVVAFAASKVGPPGAPREAELPPGPAAGAILALDEDSLTVTVSPSLGASALEAGLRERGLTLGLFPETFERATIGELLDADAPGAGASGAGFASRLVGVPGEDEVSLGIRRRPAAQAGRALAVGAFAEGVDRLRRLAQDGDLPDIAVLWDAAASELWLRAAGDPDGARARVPAGGGVLLLVTAGLDGVAARRVALAVRDCQPGVIDLGQNAARAWAGIRYDPPAHAATLARAGYDLTVERSRIGWRDVTAAAAEARAAAGWAACELAGATMHDALLTVRRITAAVVADAKDGT